MLPINVFHMLTICVNKHLFPHLCFGISFAIKNDWSSLNKGSFISCFSFLLHPQNW